ncbi:MAG: homoserine O-acetyltransferase MetX, partial [Pyrinomonadaceae bacterium]
MSQSIEPIFEGDCCLNDEQPFRLFFGGQLSALTLRYTTYGKLNKQRDNGVLVCHALSGSSRVAEWWPKLFEVGRPFDPERYFVICVNTPGSCYGSTGPLSINPQTDRRYGKDFPLISIRDIVRTQAKVLDMLGIERLHSIIGGSIGGMQALQFAIDYPERVSRSISIAATPLSAMGLALNHLQRQAIYNDSRWLNGYYDPQKQPLDGLALARSIAMCTYKSAELFAERFARRPNRNVEDPTKSLDDRFCVAGYLDYQGQLFTKRFDANSYLIMTKAMDNFDLSHGFNSEQEAIRRIKAQCVLIGISSDWLFPAEDVRSLWCKFKSTGVDSIYHELESSHGHDGFLVDCDALCSLIGKSGVSGVSG